MSVILALALSFAAQDVTEVDPLKVFYMADLTDPRFTSPFPIAHGRLSARHLEPPYAPVLTTPVDYVNGGLALDPIRGVLYGNRCCNPTAAIAAHDARTLTNLGERDIAVDTSGSVSIKIDPLRRVLFAFDGKTVKLYAFSIESASYGVQLAAIDPPLAPDTTGSSGDFMAIDSAKGRLFITGADGGSVLAIDVSELYPTRGTFGAIDATAQTARRSGNSGGSLAIDEPGRRVFVVRADGVIRSFSADPPYSTIDEYNVESMSNGDCGLWYDTRTETLYVGRSIAGELAPRPLGIDKTGHQVEIEPTAYDGDALAVYGISFTGPTGPFAMKIDEGEMPMRDPIGVREDLASCTCTRPHATHVAWWVLFSALWIIRRRAA